MEKVQFSCCETPLNRFRFHTQPKKVYDEFVSCKPYQKCQDDNVEKLREESREFPNGCKRCKIFFIINSRKNVLIFRSYEFLRV